MVDAVFSEMFIGQYSLILEKFSGKDLSFGRFGVVFAFSKLNYLLSH